MENYSSKHSKKIKIDYVNMKYNEISSRKFSKCNEDTTEEIKTLDSYDIIESYEES